MGHVVIMAGGRTGGYALRGQTDGQTTMWLVLVILAAAAAS